MPDLNYEPSGCFYMLFKGPRPNKNLLHMEGKKKGAVPRSLLPIPRVPLANRRRFSFVSQHFCQSSARLIVFSVFGDPTRLWVLLHPCSVLQLCMQLCDLLVHRGVQLMHPTTERAPLLPSSLEKSNYLLRTGKLKASLLFLLAGLLRLTFHLLALVDVFGVTNLATVIAR